MKLGEKQGVEGKADFIKTLCVHEILKQLKTYVDKKETKKPAICIDNTELRDRSKKARGTANRQREHSSC